MWEFIEEELFSLFTSRHVVVLQIDSLQEKEDITANADTCDESGADMSCLGALWMDILWRKALAHKNPQVQKLAVRSFLQRKWTVGQFSSIQSDFIFNILLPVLDVALIHKDTEFNHKKGVEHFLVDYVTSLTQNEQCNFITMMMERLSGRISRIAINCWMISFRSIAERMQLVQLIPIQNHEITISRMRGVFIYISSFHGTTFRLNLFKTFLDGIAFLIPKPEVDPLMVASCLCEIQEELLYPGPGLHTNIAAWLVPTDRMQEWVYSGLIHGLKQYLFAEEPSEESATVSSEIKMWKSTSRYLSLSYGLLVSSGRDASDILATIVQQLQDACMRTYLVYGSTLKTLLLLQCILEIALNESDKSNSIRMQIFNFTAALSKHLTSFADVCMRDLWDNKWEKSADHSQIRLGRVLAPAEWFACERAYLSVDCLMKALHFLGNVRANQETSDFSQSSADASISRLAQFALHLVNSSFPKLTDGATQSKAVLAELLTYRLRVLQCVCRGISICRALDANHLRLNSIKDRLGLKAAIEWVNRSCEDVGAGNNLRQSLELAKWECIAAIISFSDQGWTEKEDFQASDKACLLKCAVMALEYAQGPLLVALLETLQPLLRCLVIDPVFLSEAENLFEVHGYDETLWEIVQRMWPAFMDAGKKAHVCAAFMETVFLRESFACEGAADIVWAAQGEDGPFLWLVRKLLKMGERSPRIMFLLSMRLTSVLLLSPALVECYLPVLLEIILYGTTDKGHTEHQAETEYQDAPADGNVRQDVRLESGVINVYAATRVGPRVAVVSFIYELAQLAATSTNELHGSTNQSIQAGIVGRQLWSFLLNEALTDPLQCLAQYNIGSKTHRIKTRLWQALCVCSNFVTQREDIKQSLVSLCSLLARGNVSSVRMFIEATMVKMLISHPDLLWDTIMPVIEDYSQRHEALPSYMLIGLQVVLTNSTASDSIYLMNALLPWALSHHHATRAFSQLAISKLIVIAYPNLSSSGAALSDQPSDSLRRISEFIDKNADMQRLLSTLGDGVDSFRKKELCTPKSVFVVCANLAGLADEEISLEGAPESLLQNLRDYLSLERAKVRTTNQEQITAKESGSLFEPNSKSKISNELESSSRHFQRKIVPAARMQEIKGQSADHQQQQILAGLMGMDDPVDLRRMRSNPGDDLMLETIGCGYKSTQGLIMVATLIDKIPNLAGLARTCEVFGAHSLVVADARVTKDRLFTAISMTSEQWLPIHEVRSSALVPWLKAKRTEGYVLIGLEQTSESTVLGEFEFPRKCILVLGQEKEGISADVLQILDSTVEIPQAGIVRSLNVHVSGAVAMYEYSRQKLSQAQTS